MTGPISSGGASANGSCCIPTRASASPYDAGAATRTSCPAAAHARANGNSGPKWPSLAVVANSTRTPRDSHPRTRHGNHAPR